MTGRDDDTDGDYEYDLAHEDVTATQPAAAPKPDVAQPQMPEDEAGGDYSYDQAHDIPPAGS